MPLINYKVEFKLMGTNHCVLPQAGADIDNTYFKNATLYVPVETLSTKDNQKPPKLLTKGFERSVYWNEYKTKSEMKNMTNEYMYFPKPKFVGVKILC